MVNATNHSDLTSNPTADHSQTDSTKVNRASDRVANRLRQEILTGRLPVGCRLLPERKLAEVLKVSRVTVRSAIAALQSEQLLDVRRGSGITVLDYRTSSGIDLFTWLMASSGIPAHQQYRIFAQMLAVRRTMAVPTLFEAASKATPADRAMLDNMVQDQKNNLTNPDAFLVQDLEISRAIARIADNVVVELLHNSLRRCINARPELMRVFLGDVSEYFEIYPVLLNAFVAIQNIADNHSMREQTHHLIENFEKRGLDRVRAHLDRIAIETEAPTTQEVGIFAKRS